MPQTDATYSARFELPELIEQSRDNTLRCRVYRGGVLMLPSSGVVSVVSSSGASIVSDAPISVVGAVAEYSLAVSLVAGEPLGEGLVIEWDLSMPDGLIHTFRNEGAIVRARFAPTITEADLYRRVRSLDPSTGGVIHSEADFADKIEEADVMIQARLIEEGRRPWLILSPASLRASYIALTLSLIFDDFASRLDGAYIERADKYMAEFESAFSRIKLVYDENDDGKTDNPGQRKSAKRPSFWTNGRL